MGFGLLCLNFVVKFLNVISWPSFTLLYPLYYSMRAIESKSYSKSQQCLTCWVLLSIIRISEWALAGFLEWFQFWPLVKGILILLLLIPGFHGASYVYQLVIRPYVRMDSLVCSLLFSPRKGDIFIWNKNDFNDAMETYVAEDRSEQSESTLIHGIPSPTTSSRKRVIPLPTDPTRAQMWSCVLCLVNTTSEKCLKKHLKGKKHKAKEVKLRVIETPVKRQFDSFNEMSLVENYNETARINLRKWSNLLSRWCTWRKPESGCTKLNTDGSRDQGDGRLAGLLRDYNGDPICAYVSKVPTGNTFLVELLAVWRGLILAISLGIKIIWVESDSMSVVKTINREQPYSPIATFYLMKIWKELEKFKKYKVTHSYREANRAADFLSKMSLSGSDIVLQPSNFPPHFAILSKMMLKAEDTEECKYL